MLIFEEEILLFCFKRTLFLSLLRYRLSLAKISLFKKKLRIILK